MTNLIARLELARKADEYMRGALGVGPSPTALGLVESGEGRLVEFAHTPHFGHMGFFHMLLEAGRLVISDERRVLLFWSIDHDYLYGNDHALMRGIPMLRYGQPMKNVPSFGIARSDVRRPMCFVPPPTQEALDTAKEKVKAVLAYEASQAKTKKKDRKRLALDQTEILFTWLKYEARQVDSLAAWYGRCLVQLLGQIWPGIPVLILPSRMLSVIFAADTRAAHISDMQQKFAGIQRRFARPGDWPDWSTVSAPDPNEQFTPFRYLDPERGEFVKATPRTRVIPSPYASPYTAPKVIIRQPLANKLGLEYRVCGNKLGYWDVCDTISREVYDIEPPPRHQVTGYTRFYGLGGLDKRPSMLRVITEMNIVDIVAQTLVREKESDAVVISGLAEREE